MAWFSNARCLQRYVSISVIFSASVGCSHEWDTFVPTSAASSTTTSGGGDRGDRSSASGTGGVGDGGSAVGSGEGGGNGGHGGSSATSGGGSTGGGSAGGTGGHGDGGSAGGSPTFCTPGTDKSCYSGPAGTENKGLCKSGTTTCNAGGTAFGPCTGETLPKIETCATSDDENCNGIPNEHCATWSTAFNGAGDISSVAIDPAGNIWIAGNFTGTIDVGGDPIVSTSRDFFVAKYDALGVYQWSKGFGGPQTDFVRDLAVDASGNAYIVGSFSGEITFAPEPTMIANGTFDLFFAKLDANGNAELSIHAGESGKQEAVRVAVAGSQVAVAGLFEGTIDLGDGPLVAEKYNAFVAVYDSTAEELAWSKTFVGSGNETATALAFDGTTVMLAGQFDESMTIQSETHPSVGDADLFIAKLNALDGEAVWSASFPHAGVQVPLRLALGNGDAPLLVGEFTGASVDFGDGPLLNPDPTDKQTNVFLLRFDADDGVLVWSKGFGATKIDEGHALAFGTDGAVVLAGVYEDAIDFGGGTFMSSDKSANAYLARLTPDGDHEWSHSFGTPGGIERIDNMAMTDDYIVVGGQFSSVLNLGNGNLTGGGMFLAQFPK